ncbi:MAG TPA: ATP-dependent Zn protease [Geminocystis sp. M7585_C2015_104]|nr:ATP-dependent Zn protease [Geminocystis sp. M7585_C2015_104]
MQREEVGLNLLAIMVFIITILTLLGPVFHIPPTLPAFITFLLLGLVTVDTLAWKNQGTNLLLNSLAFPQQKERIIYHEAGHFLTAYLYQIPVSGYTLSPWEAFKNGQDGAAGVVLDFTPFVDKTKYNLRELLLQIEKISVVLMAGIAAEDVIYKNILGGEDDRKQMLSIYRDLGLDINQLKLEQRMAVLKAKNLIKENFSAYLALVEAMKKRLPVAECQEIIRQNLGSKKSESVV